MSIKLKNPLTETFEVRLSKLSAENMLNWAAEEFGDSLAVSTSFGIQSAVTLNLLTSIMPNINVIWVDTGYLPTETYEYAETLTQRLSLNLHTYKSHLSPAAMEEKYGKLWESDDVQSLNLYDQIRKVEPMQRALNEMKVRGWVSGLRAVQTEFRKRLPPIKRTGDRYRIYPILEWTNQDVYYYMTDNDLPQHPLFFKGYTTVGDAHSSRPVNDVDANERDTRFRGLKQECGLHLFG